jgi:hypothetical protein
MPYGCHPATGGVCGCDWETDERGRDYFVQCDVCADLWEKQPDGDWGYDDMTVQEDCAAVLRMLDDVDAAPEESSEQRQALGAAVAKALELGLLERSGNIRLLFQEWLPRLMADEKIMADMGGVLSSCAEAVGITV